MNPVPQQLSGERNGTYVELCVFFLLTWLEGTWLVKPGHFPSLAASATLTVSL